MRWIATALCLLFLLGVSESRAGSDPSSMRAAVCKGVLVSPETGKTISRRLIHTRMQEAVAPRPVDLGNFEGKIVDVSWQVDDGSALWGAVVVAFGPAGGICGGG